MTTLFEIQMKELNGIKKRRNTESLIKFAFLTGLVLSIIGKVLGHIGILI